MDSTSGQDDNSMSGRIPGFYVRIRRRLDVRENTWILRMDKTLIRSLKKTIIRRCDRTGIRRPGGDAY